MSDKPEAAKARAWRKWAIEISIFLILLVALRAYSQRDLAGGEAPRIEGRLLNGAPASLAALEGKPVLVHFWATWCPVCRMEEDSIAAIAKDHPVVTVAMQSGGAREIQAYLRKQGLDMPVVLDEEGRLAERYGVRGVPTSFVLSPSGEIRFVEVGYTTGWGLRARLWLAGL